MICQFLFLLLLYVKKNSLQSKAKGGKQSKIRKKSTRIYFKTQQIAEEKRIKAAQEFCDILNKKKQAAKSDTVMKEKIKNKLLNVSVKNNSNKVNSKDKNKTKTNEDSKNKTTPDEEDDAKSNKQKLSKQKLPRGRPPRIPLAAAVVLAKPTTTTTTTTNNDNNNNNSLIDARNNNNTINEQMTNQFAKMQSDMLDLIGEIRKEMKQDNNKNIVIEVNKLEPEKVCFEIKLLLTILNIALIYFLILEFFI